MSESDNENSQGPASNGQTMSRQEAMAKFDSIEKNMSQILSLLSNGQRSSEARLSQAGAVGSNQEGKADSATCSSAQVASNHPAAAPEFLQVAQQSEGSSSQAVGAALPAQSLSAQNLLAPAENSPKPAGTATDQASKPAKVPSMSVSSAVHTVPGFLVEKIQSGQYVDFNLLRPVTLEKLKPAEEPTQTQLTKLASADSARIRTFMDWAEAWAVYSAVLLKKAPEKVASLLGYFLLLSTACRSTPGGGWRDYDVRFRKYMVDNPSTDWGMMVPTLWMTTVVAKGAQPSKAASTVSTSRMDQPCFRWNKGNCNLEDCRFRHHCLLCQGDHPQSQCQNKGQSGSRKQSAQDSPPVARKKSSRH